MSAEDAKWFRDLIKSHARNIVVAYDIHAVEKRHKFKLPKSYIEFISNVGPVKFNNVDQERGLTVQILAPNKLDFERCRAGALDSEDEETNAIDGVVFATSRYGDCFCFDVKKHRNEFPVVRYKHECLYFEPYAANFAACIRRFAGR